MDKRVLPIPTSFELHGITYRVRLMPDLIASSDNMGEASFRLNEIWLQTVMPGVPLSVDKQGQVFCHELLHHVLREAQSDLKDNEAFVDLVASLLHQALVTAKYKEEV